MHATMTQNTDPATAPFGSLFGDSFTVATDDGNGYVYGGAAEPLRPFQMHPGAHVLHYASECFEGLKAHRQIDGSLAIFRLDDHVARFTQSVERLMMRVPDPDMVRQMIIDACSANGSATPAPPGSLYIRPTLIGTQENIGAAAAPSSTGIFYVINSPVGDYFAGGVRPLSIYVETETPRTTPQFGTVKSGANYVMALGPTLAAKAKYGIDQVLFATGGDTTETGASNFFLVDDDRLITRHLDSSFLHGVTRKSVIQIGHDLGYEVEERSISLDELFGWEGEIFLSGTAAVIAPVGTLVAADRKVTISGGQPGPNTLRLRQALTDVQIGKTPDTHHWLTPIDG